MPSHAASPLSRFTRWQILAAAAGLIALVAATVLITLLVSGDDSATTDEAETSAAEASPSSSSALPSDVLALGAQYQSSLGFDCNTPAKRGGMTGAFCIGAAVRTLNSLEPAAQSLSPSKAKGDLMLAISDWRTTHQTYMQFECATETSPNLEGTVLVTPTPSPLCTSQLDAMARQWAEIVKALGFDVPGY
ncbi:UNVERIFIED_ORG: hypothetical protein GGE11_003250 [Mycolicibacterium obuense]